MCIYINNFKDGKTCVHVAIDRNHSNVVRTLLSANPDIELKTKEGDTCLLRAVLQRNAEVVELLLDKKAKINATNNKGDTALHIAMRTRLAKNFAFLTLDTSIFSQQ